MDTSVLKSKFHIRNLGSHLQQFLLDKNNDGVCVGPSRVDTGFYLRVYLQCQVGRKMINVFQAFTCISSAHIAATRRGSIAAALKWLHARRLRTVQPTRIYLHSFNAARPHLSVHDCSDSSSSSERTMRHGKETGTAWRYSRLWLRVNKSIYSYNARSAVLLSECCLRFWWTDPRWRPRFHFRSPKRTAATHLRK